MAESIVVLEIAITPLGCEEVIDFGFFSRFFSPIICSTRNAELSNKLQLSMSTGSFNYAPENKRRDHEKFIAGSGQKTILVQFV